MKKVGILGGTFDPIHRAHLALAEMARVRYSLDEIWIMPSGNSYFKTVHGHVTDAFYRLEMCRIAIEEMNSRSVSAGKYTLADIETRRQGYTYTGDTLLQLSREYPDVEWYFIIGADSLKGMKHWYAPEVIFHCATVIVGNRNDQVPVDDLLADRAWLEQRYHGRIRLMPFASMDISSSKIRSAIHENGACTEFLTKKVADYIRERHLYREPMTIAEIDADLKRRLKTSRYVHTLGVAETARKMAEHYGTVDPERAWLAGMIHDCGKYEGTALTHGPVGARIARNEYGIQDEEMLSAVYWHTTGKPDMTDLEKIIFIADYIEPNRDKAPHLDELRAMAMTDMDHTVVEILRGTLRYLQDIRAKIDGASIQTYDYYKKITES